MSIADLVPSSSFRISDPAGSILSRSSLKSRVYRFRRDGTLLDPGQILSARGISDPQSFLATSLRSMPDPSSMQDMDIAAARLAKAIQKKQSILVFGDYDVDGACSSAIMTRFIRMLGHDCDVYIPDRTEDGYGPSESAFLKCKPDKYHLVIFVDCGTASGQLLEAIAADVIVVDHHMQQGDLPLVHAVVNPHRFDDESGLDMVCAAGLAFMFCAATRRTLRARGYFVDGEPDLRELLDLAALATVADVVPLIGLSRILVAGGLDVMRNKPSTGVGALMAAAGVEDASAGRIGFALGPRINAAGRVGGGTSSEEGALGFELLVCQDQARAIQLAGRLNSLNSERQAVEKVVLDESLEKAAIHIESGARIICVASENWHPGVIGIVAGRLREKFGVPAIVGSIKDGVIKASGRSVPGFDLGKLIIEARTRGLLVGGGGHAMACGLSCNVDGWQGFIDFIQERSIWEDMPSAIDCSCATDRISIDKVEALDMMEPLGQGNPTPVVLVERFKVRGARPFGKGHIRLVSTRDDVEVLFWRAEEEGISGSLEALVGKTVDIVGTPKVSEWMGKKKVSINGIDVIS